tara:strand:+ start:535 stop:1035 length:501 start_codon:yes stop_codon:yes gene_type:complete
VRGRGSRNKGANFERQVARLLRKWLGDDWEVKRNPTDRQNGKAGAGEFEIVGPYTFPFAIECKAHESFDYSQLFRVPATGPFSGFWEQASKQAQSADKMPMLILKKNNGPVLCAMEPTAIKLIVPRPERMSFMSLERPRCIVFPLSVLLEQPASYLFEVAPVATGL